MDWYINVMFENNKNDYKLIYARRHGYMNVYMKLPTLEVLLTINIIKVCLLTINLR